MESLRGSEGVGAKAYFDVFDKMILQNLSLIHISGPIAAVAVLLVNVSAKIFYIMALITLVVLLMTSGCMRLLDVGALQRILLTAWAGADNAGGRTGGNLCRRFLDVYKRQRP